jgi:hypothetical protein
VKITFSYDELKLASFGTTQTAPIAVYRTEALSTGDTVEASCGTRISFRGEIKCCTTKWNVTKQSPVALYKRLLFFQVSTVVSCRCWFCSRVVTLYGCGRWCRRFRGICCPHLQGSSMQWRREATYTSETSVSSPTTAWCNNPRTKLASIEYGADVHASFRRSRARFSALS